MVGKIRLDDTVNTWSQREWYSREENGPASWGHVLGMQCHGGGGGKGVHPAVPMLVESCVYSGMAEFTLRMFQWNQSPQVFAPPHLDSAFFF